MSTDTALEKRGPQSTGIGLFGQAPNQNTALATVVPLDRENLAFFANMIKSSGLIPVVNGVTPEMSFNRVMAKIVAGTSYGFDPILAQSCFDVMFEQVSLNAKGQGILFKQSGEYDFRIDSHDDKHCEVTVFRLSLERTKWEAIGAVRFDEEMAKTAGLLGKDLWKKYPRDMYFARVMTRMVKRYNASCLTPRLVLGNHFAKESQPTFNAPLPPSPTPPAALASSNESPTNGDAIHVTDEPIDGEVVPTEAASEGVEQPGEVVEFTGDNEPDVATPERFELLGSIKTLLELKVGTKEKDVKAFLGGVDLAQADTATLEETLERLKAL